MLNRATEVGRGLESDSSSLGGMQRIIGTEVEYGISSPTLKVSRTKSQITIELSGFDEPLSAEFVDTYLTNWRRGTLQLLANQNKAGKREKAETATSSFPSVAEIPLTAIAEINRKAKRRYYA